VPNKISKVVYTIGTYNIPNLTNVGIVAKDGKTFSIPQIISSVDEFTKNRMNYFFEEVDKFENQDNYATIDLSDLELTDDATPKFTFGALVESSTEQSIVVDIVGYTNKWVDANEDGNVNASEKEIKLVYQVTVIYYSAEGIIAKGTLVKDTTIQLIDKLVTPDSLNVTLFYGKDVAEDDANALAEELEQRFPDCDINMISGEQPVYYYIISVE
jgi:dihydroxyacetone kinase-like predicted kinase